MKYDEKSGLYVPEDYERVKDNSPNFPPRFDVMNAQKDEKVTVSGEYQHIYRKRYNKPHL